MDEKQAAALRKKFSPTSIGKLPKPRSAQSPKGQCGVCGGYHGLPAVHLDYVGHAATTDRLLQVDPEWSWEPMAYDMSGLPMLDANRNLWIKLTVCGVTRIGVGDGKSLKECIGDAIRNAAMRFGVALDLWAKEDLQAVDDHEVEQVAPPAAQPAAEPATRTMSRKPSISKVATEDQRQHEPAPEPDDGWSPPDDKPKGGLRTEAQSVKLHASFGDAGIKGRDNCLAYLTNLLGHPVESTKDLTATEAHKAIDALAQDAKDAS